MTRDSITGKFIKKHGLWLSPEYSLWQGLKNRCFNKNNKDYSLYGGRGITVNDSWINSFETFIKDVGPRPGPGSKYSLDRINNNGNYEPGNTRWATRKEQANNRYQSPTCKRNYNLVKSECLGCGKTYIKNLIGKSKNYCERKCYCQHYQRQKIKGLSAYDNVTMATVCQ